MAFIRRSLIAMAGALLVFGSLHGQEAKAEESRLFTARDGRSVEASFIEEKSGFVKLSRKADGLSFIMEITELSDADQEWIRQHLAGASQSVPKQQDFGNGWARLVIRLPGGIDEPQVVGTKWDDCTRRVDAFHHEIILPKGAWVKLMLFKREGNIESMIRYEGASRWEVSIDNLVTYVKRDDGPVEPAGVSLPVDNAADYLAKLDLSKVTRPVSLEIRSEDHSEALSAINFPIHAFLWDDVEARDVDVMRMSTYRPKALALDIEIENLQLLEEFPQLESLFLETRGIPTRSEGADGGKITVEPFDLPAMPALRELSIQAPAGHPDFPNLLSQRTPNLRMLFYYMRSRSTVLAEWKGLDQLPGLEALYIPRGIRVPAGEVAQLKGLRSLSFGDRGIHAADRDLPKLLNELDLIHLHCTHLSISPSIWEGWAKSGGLSSLVRLETFQQFDLSPLSSVELLNLRRQKSDQPRGAAGLAGLSALEQLRYLSISYATQEEVEAVAELSNRHQIETMRFSNGRFTDLSPLSDMANLKRLVCLYFNCEEMPVLDVSQFPMLRTLTLQSLKGLTTLNGAANHPRLESLSVQDCRELWDLGQPSPNNVLQRLAFLRCYALSNLDAFGQTSGLRQLNLQNCSDLGGPLSLLENNPLDFEYIINSGVFPERPVYNP